MTMSARASGKVATILVFSNTSIAPEARVKLSSGSLKSEIWLASKTGGVGVMGVAMRLGATKTN